jgi:hypothetical protein
MWAVFGTAPDDMWAVGDDGVIIQRVGAVWTRVESGTDPRAGRDPQVIAAASEGIRAAMEKYKDMAQRWGQRQFRSLVAGAVLYVVWHILEMYLRRFPVPWLV